MLCPDEAAKTPAPLGGGGGGKVPRTHAPVRRTGGAQPLLQQEGNFLAKQEHCASTSSSGLPRSPHFQAASCHNGSVTAVEAGVRARGRGGRNRTAKPGAAGPRGPQGAAASFLLFPEKQLLGTGWQAGVSLCHGVQRADSQQSGEDEFSLPAGGKEAERGRGRVKADTTMTSLFCPSRLDLLLVSNFCSPHQFLGL